MIGRSRKPPSAPRLTFADLLTHSRAGAQREETDGGSQDYVRANTRHPTPRAKDALPVCERLCLDPASPAEGRRGLAAPPPALHHRTHPLPPCDPRHPTPPRRESRRPAPSAQDGVRRTLTALALPSTPCSTAHALQRAACY